METKTARRASLLAAIAVLCFVACQSTDSTAPDLTSTSNDALVLAAVPCPPAASMCDGIGKIVYDACPPDSAYKNHGEYMSCVSQTLTAALKDAGLDNCYSAEERNALKVCAMEWKPTTTPSDAQGDFKTRFHDGTR